MPRRPARTIAHPFICDRVREEEVRQFARHTPPEVANWLRPLLASTPDHPVLRALATDDRMSDLWMNLGPWEPKVWLVQIAFHFSTPTIISALQRKPQERDNLVFSEYTLGINARHFAVVLEWFKGTAAELWGKPVEGLIEDLHSFADAAFERGEAKQAVYDHIPEPERRGRGIRKQRAFREALSSALERICEEHPLSSQKRDFVIATLTSVAFPGWDVDVDTISRDRKRRRNRAKG